MNAIQTEEDPKVQQANAVFAAVTHGFSSSADIAKRVLPVLSPYPQLHLVAVRKHIQALEQAGRIERFDDTHPLMWTRSGNQPGEQETGPIPALDRARYDGPWKATDDDNLPFHPNAHHVDPAFRDGWNAGWWAQRTGQTG